MVKRLFKLCKGDHRHQQLLSGRAADAAFYPLLLLRAILQGIADTEFSDGAVRELSEQDYDTRLVMSMCAVTPAEAEAVSTDQGPGARASEGGGTVQLNYHVKDVKDQ